LPVKLQIHAANKGACITVVSIVDSPRQFHQTRRVDTSEFY
jgi:hypothetical protein